MRKILVIVSLFLLSIASVSAQLQTVIVAEPIGSSTATYKNAAKTAMLNAMQGMSTINAVTNATADSIVAMANVNHNSTDVSSATLTALQNLNNVNFVCYTIITENGGRIYLETMLLDCATGKIVRPQTTILGRNLSEVEEAMERFAKVLIFE